MFHETPALEAQYQSLQALVCQLLIQNQRLREELARLRPTASTATATHPPQPQDH